MTVLAVWNIQSGGFEAYDEVARVPPRMQLIEAGVWAAQADVMGLVDTFRWTEVFSPAELSQRFGYRHAITINMNCDRVDERVGLTLLHNYANATWARVRLVTRDCLKLIVPVARGEAWLYLVYLDDVSEALREQQIAALLVDVSKHPHGPCMIMGDFNTLRPAAVTPLWRGLGWCARLPLVRRIRHIVAVVAREYTKAQVVPRLEEAGFVDVGAHHSRLPTLLAGKWGLYLRWCVDYVFVRGLVAESYEVLPQSGVSDHSIVKTSVASLGR